MFSEPGERPRILIVDDAPQNLRHLSGLLRGTYRISVAVSGREALALAAERPHDLILLDVVMPEMDGYEVCRRLKAFPATRQIPVIFITGLTAEEERPQSLEAGAADFIAKPIDPEKLQAKIRDCLRHPDAGTENGG
ncbi:response regulator [Trichloromonas sp.]|uniref:response regulator n=1 Tax=Trichloromonas sp. TaxID=3069249 RepID=UPI002A38AB0E|nr:response regulator [Trichloromonas sp.]